MLTSIRIAGEATYPEAGDGMTDIKKVNYLFGHNGCGKTTISRVIHDPSARPGYSVSWKDDRPISTLVYNRDFADANFGEHLQGIFTLGEESAHVVEEIESLQAKIRMLDIDIDGLRQKLDGDGNNSGCRKDLESARSLLDEACWASQKTHKAAFEDAMTGYRQGKVAFSEKILKEHADNTADLATLEDLSTRAATLFKGAPTQEPSIPLINLSTFANMERDAILTRKVIGRDDVVIAALIGRLGNSDWVKQGMGYLPRAEDTCPFCQQKAPLTLQDDLNAFFDEQYEADLQAITQLVTRYERSTAEACRQLDALVASPSRFVDPDAFASRYHALKTAFELNRERLAAKRREPSNEITLEKTKEFTDAIGDLLARANAAINVHNETVRDLSSAKRELTAQVWRFLVEERRTDLVTYDASAAKLSKMIAGIESKIASKEAERRQLDIQLRTKEAGVTSVKPTVDGINRILSSFGFTSFMLSVAGDHEEMYRIVRLDGAAAAKTLSEGERSFVTFLYFYHLLSGSTSGTGTTVDKVVVFDDPVSSLDADVLFIVSALIRKVVDDIRRDRGAVRQVFVLTHNIYFHKEVSFDRDRAHSQCRKDEMFWIVRKRDNISSLHRYEFNPVKTSYELLWEDVRNSERANLTIQNTLRRIVENYLVVLGGWKPDTIVALFEGREAQVCASLFSWINDGSHSSHDDLYVVADDSAVQNYLRVFRQVFEKTGHVAHYKMMMKITDEAEEEVPESALNATLSDGAMLSSAANR